MIKMPQTPNEESIISCTRCSINVPISQTTYENSSKNLICFECYNKMARGQQPERIILHAESPYKVDYKCMSCGFKFSRGKEFAFGGRCFNCGKASVQTEQ